jgi:hypothetical protein
MARPSDCDGCRQAQSCQEVYRKLDGDAGPSVTCASLVAFVLPLVLFVAALGGWGRFLKGRVLEPCQTPLALMLALATAAAAMLAVRFFARRRGK